jgi:hypothetical protein
MLPPPQNSKITILPRHSQRAATNQLLPPGQSCCFPSCHMISVPTHISAPVSNPVCTCACLTESECALALCAHCEQARRLTSHSAFLPHGIDRLLINAAIPVPPCSHKISAAMRHLQLSSKFWNPICTDEQSAVIPYRTNNLQ